MKKILFCYFLLSISLFSCKQESSKKAENTTQEEMPRVLLLCESLSQDVTEPLYAVYAIIEDGKVKIAETNVCETLDKDQWTDYEIPAEALAAAGGWWAGGGDYFYAIQKGEEIHILQAFIDESMAEEPYTYELLAIFRAGKFSFKTIE
ncbi:MAG: hypothetical protein AAF705_20070 [Bacteroidota bacterium]